jgi:hypothetical protein
MEVKQPKKPITDLFDQLALAYKQDLLLGYAYSSETLKLNVRFYPRTNMPIQTLVRHIETTYPVEYVHVKNCYTELVLCIKFGKYSLNPIQKSFVFLKNK